MNITEIKKRCEAADTDPRSVGMISRTLIRTDVPALVAWVEAALPLIVLVAAISPSEETRAKATQLLAEVTR